MELLPFVDILKVFNNPINEEQAWAVCYQCAIYLYRNSRQEYYQDICDSEIHSIWLSRDGDVYIRKGPSDPNGSGKGPPSNQEQRITPTSPAHSSFAIHNPKRRHVIATETDAVQSLGLAIFEALDFGIESSEERQLSPGLESLIVTMTNADSSTEEEEGEAHNAQDEGIEKDADVEHRCSLLDVLRMCRSHLSSKQDARHHFKAVCRALATEASELFTFLDKISHTKEKLSAETSDEDSRQLEELQRADWACLWVQVMRSLRQGVRLKKVEHVHHPPLEYELTPFEMILEDIRSRRYTLHKIMVNGEIPHKVKNDAHAVILDFIRSRPPLKKVDERKLKPKQPVTLDPHELLLRDIRARPKLKPVKLPQSTANRVGPAKENSIEKKSQVKKIIKPDFDLILNNSFEESSEDEEQRDRLLTSRVADMSPMSSSYSSASHETLTPLNESPNLSPTASRRFGSRDALFQDVGLSRPNRLQRRHTIMVCESPSDGKVHSELPPLEEEDEPSPVRECHSFPLVNHQSARRVARQFTTSHVSHLHHELDLNQVSLRHASTGSGYSKRQASEHRRSLTALTGLSSIPEQDDINDGSQLQRTKSVEQAPPANLSPPVKGKAKAGLHQFLSRQDQLPPKSPSKQQEKQQSWRTVSGKARSMTSPQSMMGNVSTELSSDASRQHDLSSSPTSTQHASLDLSVSSQSPSYSRRQIGKQNCDSRGSCIDSSQHRSGRWRDPKSREERLNRRKTQTATDEESPDESRPRRLSLDGGVNVYQEQKSEKESPVSRRLSMQVGRNTRNAEDRLSSFEEEERLTRWRALQEEEMKTRTKPDALTSHISRAQSLPAKSYSPSKKRLRNHLLMGASEETDVLQQKMADEDVRLARWRYLEESEGSESRVDPEEYVSGQIDNKTGLSLSGEKIYGAHQLPKRWQNPIECLSLTLEEVTHIRSVLTKAELESLISHPDLYQQVARNKMCFTCKTTRFSLFGEWGTKCKFCKRTVCSKCIRKMNVPTDQFKNIPVYTLSPTQINEQMKEFIDSIVKNAPMTSVPPTREVSPSRSVPTATSSPGKAKPDDSTETTESQNFFSRNISPLQRSQSLLVPGQRMRRVVRTSLKGQLMTICCDCKTMVVEIIRASKASLSIMSSSSSHAPPVLQDLALP